MFLDIFFVFFKISLVSFGGIFGVLPQLEHMIVVERGWISQELFIQSYVMGQFVPGPNMAMCPLIGYWVYGWSGFVAGFLGIYLVPLSLMILVYYFYKRLRKIDEVRRVEHSLRPMVLGLCFASLLRLWWIQSRGLSPWNHAELLQVASLVMCVSCLILYRRGLLGSLQCIFLMGFMWWTLNWGVGQFFG